MKQIMDKSCKIVNEAQLLTKFNNRDSSAFSSVYSLYYEDFHYYASYLYDGTSVESEDIIHDIFLELWQNKHVKFDQLIKIKGYIFIAIKNGFKNYKNHTKYEHKYAESFEVDANFELDVLEYEVYSMVDKALEILPSECAKVFKLYIDGYKPEEIAQMLDKKIQTVYNTKQEAISILRRKFPKDKLLLLLSLIN